MQERCVGDVLICKVLWHFLQPDGYSQDALALKHRIAAICDELTATGVPFDLEAAEQSRRQWTARRAELEAHLAEQFPGVNLNSRVQLGHVLQARGWVAERHTPKTGRPKIDDEVLEALPALYPEFAGISEHYTLGRRLGQLANGKKAWTKNVGADARIHGGIVHIGTPHSRAAHLEPNLAQVPNPKKGKPFAAECRALFRAPAGWVMVAADQAGLQDRGFAHYLAAFDDGAYAATFANAGAGDTHWSSALALGLVPVSTARDKQSRVHEVIREGAKRFRYAFLYGAGMELAGRIISDIGRAAAAVDAGNDLQQRFFGGSAHPNEVTLKRVGKQALDKFEAGTRGLKRLRQSLQARARQHQWLPGLDGRRVPVRALHSALNFIVTSSEAIICKRWLVNVHDELHARFRYGWDGDVVLVLWVHDELVACCRPEIAEEVGAIMVRHGSSRPRITASRRRSPPNSRLAPVGRARRRSTSNRSRSPNQRRSPSPSKRRRAATVTTTAIRSAPSRMAPPPSAISTRMLAAQCGCGSRAPAIRPFRPSIGATIAGCLVGRRLSCPITCPSSWRRHRSRRCGFVKARKMPTTLPRSG
jgi:DNA polymerase I-like protein with 3'-5' exonuclease and polymerase domains